MESSYLLNYRSFAAVYIVIRYATMNVEVTTECEHSSSVDFKPGRRFGKWRIKNKLDEGGFGQVYRVEHIQQRGRYAALKAEPNDVEGGSAIKLEVLLQFSWISLRKIPNY
uniref:Protein kinase domain-containing protein n=1 Tax=Setaria digitata TaxID=48799 RepID=A0A915PKI6_9BILA